MGLHPQFTLHIQAEGGNLPPDLSLLVIWSAAEEPVFRLNEPMTWGNAAMGSNVLCDVEAPDGQPPENLTEISCTLWTVGPTKIHIEAAGYEPLEQTLVPMQSEDCEMPLPMDIPIVLTRDTDAGPLP